jgi:Domain of unknown function DUF11
MKNFNYLLRRSRHLLSTTVISLVLVATSASLVLSAPLPASGSHQPLFAPAPEEGEEYIRTYSGDCATFKIFYAPGDQVCAEAGNFFSLNLRPRRFQWVAPDGQVVELKDISADPDFNIIELPESGPLAQDGRWTIRSIGRTASVKARGSFIVRNPFHVNLDLSITITGPERFEPLDILDYEIHMLNDGPDAGLDIEFVDEVPTNMTFVGLRQLSGPEFDCVTPKQGETGSIVCRSRGMDLDETASFLVQYQVNVEAREGDTCTGTVQITSSTPDSVRENNYQEKRYTVVGPER